MVGVVNEGSELNKAAELKGYTSSNNEVGKGNEVIEDNKVDGTS